MASQKLDATRGSAAPMSMSRKAFEAGALGGIWLRARQGKGNVRRTGDIDFARLLKKEGEGGCREGSSAQDGDECARCTSMDLMMKMITASSLDFYRPVKIREMESHKRAPCNWPRPAAAPCPCLLWRCPRISHRTTPLACACACVRVLCVSNHVYSECMRESKEADMLLRCNISPCNGFALLLLHYSFGKLSRDYCGFASI